MTANPNMTTQEAITQQQGWSKKGTIMVNRFRKQMMVTPDEISFRDDGAALFARDGRTFAIEAEYSPLAGGCWKFHAK